LAGTLPPRPPKPLIEVVWYTKSTRKRTWKAKVGTNLQKGRK
jgi:hypothetical protein